MGSSGLGGTDVGAGLVTSALSASLLLCRTGQVRSSGGCGLVVEPSNEKGEGAPVCLCARLVRSRGGCGLVVQSNEKGKSRQCVWVLDWSRQVEVVRA
jgi:hypothetical protein